VVLSNSNHSFDPSSLEGRPQRLQRSTQEMFFCNRITIEWQTWTFHFMVWLLLSHASVDTKFPNFCYQYLSDLPGSQRTFILYGRACTYYAEKWTKLRLELAHWQTSRVTEQPRSTPNNEEVLQAIVAQKTSNHSTMARQVSQKLTTSRNQTHLFGL